MDSRNSNRNPVFARGSALREIGAGAYAAKIELGTALVKAIEAAVVGGNFVIME